MQDLFDGTAPNRVSLVGRTAGVLGAGGFIGRHLCQRLPETGARIKALSRRRDAEQEAFQNIEWVTADFADENAMRAFVADCDVVFHLITETKPNTANDDKILDLRGNVENSIRLLNCCCDAGVSKVVFASSGGTIYGLQSVLPVSEDAATNPLSAYGIGKLAIEKYLYLYNHLYGLDYTALRISNPFGEGQLPSPGTGVIATFMLNLVKGNSLTIFGDGTSVRDYVYVDDVVSALIKAAEVRHPHKVFNIGTGIGRSVLDLADAITGAAGLTPQLVYKPAHPTAVPANVLDISRARRVLDWQPENSWEESVEKTFDWYKRHFSEN